MDLLLSGVVLLLLGLGSYQLIGAAEYGALDVALVGLANFSNGEREEVRIYQYTRFRIHGTRF